MEERNMDAGRVGILMAGSWNTSRSYEMLSCVSHNGKSWGAKKDVPAGVEPSEANSAFWQLMSDRGVQGIQGPVGPQGNSAFDGTGVEIVNNLTQGGQSAVLSAEQGKVLKTELTELESELGSYTENAEFIRAYTDADGRFLWGIRHDGSIEFASGVPTPIKDYIQSLNLASKKDLAKLGEYELHPEYIRAYLDAEGRLVFGIKTDGSIEWLKGVPTPIRDYVDSIDRNNAAEFNRINEILSALSLSIDTLKEGVSEIQEVLEKKNGGDYISATTDAEGRILEGIMSDGTKVYPKQTMLEKYSDAEGRSEIVVDAENRIISYRDNKGTQHEHRLDVSDILILSDKGLAKLRDDFFSKRILSPSPIDWSAESTITLPIPRQCAKVNIISESGLATTKTQDKKCELEFWDKDGNYFRKYIILNAQGSSSMDYSVKNQSIDVFNDKDCTESCDITFGTWVAQDSFHLKVYYIDVFRGLANIGYNLCEKAIQKLNSRNNRIAYDRSAITSSNSSGEFSADFGDGALCHPDGFPFELFVNGEYYGLYAWNLKKHRKNYSMDKKDYSQALLDGVLDEVTFFNGKIDWTQFELRNPKTLITMDGEEYDADYNCNELIDSSSSNYDAGNKDHVNTAKVKELVVRQSEAVNLIASANDEEAKAIFEQYYDKAAMICYFVMSNVIYHYDGFRKNWIWTIFGDIAAPSFYDLDTIFGRNWKGTAVESGSTSAIIGTALNLPTGQLVRLYKNEIDAAYKILRDSDIISLKTVMSCIYDWIDRVGLQAYQRNIEKWPNIPSYRKEKTEEDGTYAGGMYDSPVRIEKWLTSRLVSLDRYFNYQ